MHLVLGLVAAAGIAALAVLLALVASTIRRLKRFLGTLKTFRTEVEPTVAELRSKAEATARRAARLAHRSAPEPGAAPGR